MKVVVDKSDFDFDWFSGTGAGGQHRNKHQNCLRLTHRASGITVTAQSSRDRKSNTVEAYEKIAPLLAEWYGDRHIPKPPPKMDTVVRSYKVEDGLVVDHRTGSKVSIRTLDDLDLTLLISEVLSRPN